MFNLDGCEVINISDQYGMDFTLIGGQRKEYTESVDLGVNCWKEQNNHRTLDNGVSGKITSMGKLVNKATRKERCGTNRAGIGSTPVTNSGDMSGLEKVGGERLPTCMQGVLK